MPRKIGNPAYLQQLAEHRKATPKPPTTMRRCLKCGELFPSIGSGNKLCRKDGGIGPVK